MRDEDERTLIKRAVGFHGHLGPFLVIGVRMGKIAKKTLCLDAEGTHRLRAVISVPLSTPHSCTIDGVQVATGCTVGNQKLKIEESKRIAAYFRVLNTDKSLQISLNPKIGREVAEKMAMGKPPEELAAEITKMSNDELFSLKKK